MLRNAAASYATFAIQVLVGLAATPLLLHGIGQARFGLFSVLVTLAGYVGTLELGLGTASLRRVAAFAAQDDELGLRQITRTALILYAAISATGAVILLGLAIALPGLLPGSGTDGRIALVLLGAGQLVALAMNAYPALVIGSGRSSALVWTSVGGVVGVGIVQALSASATHSLVAVAVGTGIVGVVQAVLVRHVAKRSVRIELSGGRFSGALARSLFVSGWRNAAIAIAATLSYGVDLFVVGREVSLAAAAAYGVANRAAGVVFSLSSRGTDVLVPTYAHHSSLGSEDRVFSIYRESVVAAWLISLPVGIAVFTAGPGLLHLWLGTVPAGSLLVLRVVVFTVLMAIPGTNAFKVLSGIDRLGFVVCAAGITAVANLVASLALVRTVGLSGPALGTLATSAVYDVLVMPSYVCRVCSGSWASLGRAWRFLALPTAVTVAVALASRTLGSSAPATVGQIAAVVFVFAATAALCMGRTRRAAFRRLSRRV